MKIEIELTKEDLDKLNSICNLTNLTKKELCNNIYLIGD